MAAGDPTGDCQRGEILLLSHNLVNVPCLEGEAGKRLFLFSSYLSLPSLKKKKKKSLTGVESTASFNHALKTPLRNDVLCRSVPGLCC